MPTPVVGPSGMVDREIRVDGAGDARANVVYALCGAQNSSPLWRHVDRSWLCILRDGSNWWIGDETAAREDLYWMDAAAPGAWNVCPCDDRSHRHFKGSAPAPTLSWHDPRAPAPACDRRIFATEECPVCLAPPVEAARAPCCHVACALCLARARARTRRRRPAVPTVASGVRSVAHHSRSRGRRTSRRTGRSSRRFPRSRATASGRWSVRGARARFRTCPCPRLGPPPRAARLRRSWRRIASDRPWAADSASGWPHSSWAAEDPTRRRACLGGAPSETRFSTTGIHLKKEIT